MKGRKPDWIASVVVDVDGGKSRWREIGAAFKSEKDTITVLLDAVPVSGKLVLMPPREKEREPGQD